MRSKRNFAGKVTKIAIMPVRLVTLEGLQPIVILERRQYSMRIGRSEEIQGRMEILDCHDHCV